MGPTQSDLPVTVIGSGARWGGLGTRDLLARRELLYFLVWRDLKIRYRQTIFGALWALIQPAGLLVVFTLTIGRVGGIAPSGTPYPVFVFTALVPWTLFSQGLIGSANSLVSSASLLQKVYFPRLLLPIAAIGVYLLDFAVAGVALTVVVLAAGFTPTIAWLAVVPLTLLVIAAIAAAGTWFAALNVRYRDVRVVLPFLIQIWLFASPVAYSPTLVPEEWRFVYELNPMVGAIEGFRWALLGDSFPGSALAISVLVTAVVLAGGIWYFRRVEQTFADVI
jgi:homopolymeric O-antigen transport system permease protein